MAERKGGEEVEGEKGKRGLMKRKGRREEWENSKGMELKEKEMRGMKNGKEKRWTKVRGIISFRAASIMASFMRCLRHRSNTSNS